MALSVSMVIIFWSHEAIHSKYRNSANYFLNAHVNCGMTFSAINSVNGSGWKLTYS